MRYPHYERYDSHEEALKEAKQQRLLAANLPAEERPQIRVERDLVATYYTDEQLRSMSEEKITSAFNEEMTKKGHDPKKIELVFDSESTHGAGCIAITERGADRIWLSETLKTYPKSYVRKVIRHEIGHWEDNQKGLHRKSRTGCKGHVTFKGLADA